MVVVPLEASNNVMLLPCCRGVEMSVSIAASSRSKGASPGVYGVVH